MLAYQRRARILDLVHDRGSMSVSDLAQHFGTSESTIRRDLNRLDEQGALTRVRGGGIHGGVPSFKTLSESPHDTQDLPFATVAMRSAEEKDRIGRSAAALVPDQSVVLIDIGTTGVMVARHLRHRDVTVVTASFAVADELRGECEATLVVLGGVLRTNYLSLVGSLTEHALEAIRADIAFVGTSGIRHSGALMDSTGMEVPIKKSIIAHSEQTFAVASSDKFPGSGLLTVCHLSDLTGVVTTAEISTTPSLADLEGTNTKVISA